MVDGFGLMSDVVVYHCSSLCYISRLFSWFCRLYKKDTLTTLETEGQNRVGGERGLVFLVRLMYYHVKKAPSSDQISSWIESSSYVDFEISYK